MVSKVTFSEHTLLGSINVSIELCQILLDFQYRPASYNHLFKLYRIAYRLNKNGKNFSIFSYPLQAFGRSFFFDSSGSSADDSVLDTHKCKMREEKNPNPNSNPNCLVSLGTKPKPKPKLIGPNPNCLVSLGTKPKPKLIL